MSKKRWTNGEATKVIGRWQRSGLSLAEFGRKHGWDEQRLRYWAARVREGGERTKRTPLTRLIPGVVMDSRTSLVSVTLPRGVSIEARQIEAVTPEWVAAVVQALEAER